MSTTREITLLARLSPLRPPINNATSTGPAADASSIVKDRMTIVAWPDSYPRPKTSSRTGAQVADTR